LARWENKERYLNRNLGREYMENKDKKILDFLKKVSPGGALRNVIDDIIRSDLGALIVLDSPKLQDCFEGGFRVNCRFTQQRLFELCKMDGAVIISPDLKRILYGNAFLIPDKRIQTSETGTRHKAAEKTAKQAETFVIAVSERKRKTTVYYSKVKTFLRNTEEIRSSLTNNLQILEKQRENLNELLGKLNILEISNLVTIGDVCKVLQRGEIIERISNSMRRELIEIGKEGMIIHMRFRELIKGVERKQEELIRDYSHLPLKRTKVLLSNLTFESLTETDIIAKTIFQKELEENITPKGFRFLSYLELDEKEVSSIVGEFRDLENIMKVNNEIIETLIKEKAKTFREDIETLRGQILEGKVFF
jgi:diadenylate cyclase